MFLEYLWSPSISEQAMDRVHRISQTNDVKIFELYCKGSIEMQKSVRCLVKKLDMEGIL
jgi:SNF2 family DNA or RNA helicase